MHLPLTEIGSLAFNSLNILVKLQKILLLIVILSWFTDKMTPENIIVWSKYLDYTRLEAFINPIKIRVVSILSKGVPMSINLLLA